MPPVVIAAGVASAAAIGGAVMSSKAQKSAANQASQTAADNTAANNALTREQYAQNYATLNPYAQRGNTAGNAINSLLGLGMPQQQGGPDAMQLPQQAGQTAFSMAAPNGLSEGIYNDLRISPRQIGGAQGGGRPVWGMNQPQLPGTVGGYGGGTFNPDGTQVTPVDTGQQDYENAFQNYQNSTGFQFRQSEGNNALNAGYAANGALRSGAAMKDFARFNQNIASDEFGNYLAQLGRQQNVGLAGASAIAGVGQNMVNNVTANNNSAATVAANAALARGQANANMYGGIANGIGRFLGSSFG